MAIGRQKKSEAEMHDGNMGPDKKGRAETASLQGEVCFAKIVRCRTQWVGRRIGTLGDRTVRLWGKTEKI